MRADELRYAALSIRAAFTEGKSSDLSWADSQAKTVYDVLLQRANKKSEDISVST